eukprot:6180268-Pleurochrysis_carterae.AAC.2
MHLRSRLGLWDIVAVSVEEGRAEHFWSLEYARNVLDSSDDLTARVRIAALRRRHLVAAARVGTGRPPSHPVNKPTHAGERRSPLQVGHKLVHLRSSIFVRTCVPSAPEIFKKIPVLPASLTQA